MAGSLIVVTRLAAGLWLWLAALAILAPLRAEPRIALVITNQAYSQEGAKLTSTHRDGDLVAAALRRSGFNVTIVRDTGSERVMMAAIAEHVSRLADAGPDAVGFFYYSGHGAADRPDGTNYLIPTEAQLTHSAQLPLMGLPLDKITNALAGVAKINFVVFDACRNVPLQRGEKAAPFKGFAPMRERSGLLVAWATEPGNVAVDQSVYAKALADEIVKPGIEAGTAFRAVRRRVLAETENRQQPEYLDKRLYDFSFVGQENVSVSNVVPQMAGVADQMKEQVRAIQDGLRRAGCFASESTGYWGPKTRAAAEEFNRHSKKKISTDQPTMDAINVLNNAGLTGCPESEPLALELDFEVVPDQIRDCDTCPKLLVVAASSFSMGSQSGDDDELPILQVEIAKPFAVARTETTLAEWEECVRAGACRNLLPTLPANKALPVVNVSWEEAVRYAEWLSSKTKKRYRLPSEAEWEFVAKAHPPSSGQVNCNGCSAAAGTALPVGSLSNNPTDASDLLGNVAEWIQDCSTKTYVDAPKDGSAHLRGDCSQRGVRGGSWYQGKSFARPSDRNFEPVGKRAPHIGFRVVREM